MAKWRGRADVADRRKRPPNTPRSTALTPEEEAIAVIFRRRTLLALGDCLYTLQATLSRLMRSSLLGCIQRPDISLLPDVDGERPA